MAQAKCISACYDKTKDMKKCSITSCRALNDKRGDGRNGRYSYYAHVVKSLYAYQFLMWFEYFPKSSFFVFTIEQYRKNPMGVTEAFLNFMGLPLFDPEMKVGKMYYIRVCVDRVCNVFVPLISADDNYYFVSNVSACLF